MIRVRVRVVLGLGLRIKFSNNAFYALTGHIACESMPCSVLVMDSPKVFALKEIINMLSNAGGHFINRVPFEIFLTCYGK